MINIGKKENRKSTIKNKKNYEKKLGTNKEIWKKSNKFEIQNDICQHSATKQKRWMDGKWKYIMQKIKNKK